MFLARKHTVESSMLCRYAALFFVHTICFALRAFVLKSGSKRARQFSNVYKRRTKRNTRPWHKRYKDWRQGKLK